MSVIAPPRPVVPQAVRREQAEAQLLEAALHLVSEHGSTAMTLADVGERAGFSRGLPRHYFGSKEGLITALGDYMVRRFTALFVSGPKPRQGLAAVLARMEAYLAGAEADPTQFKALQVLMTEAMLEGGSPERLRSVVEANAETLRYFRHHLAAGQAAGELRPDFDAEAQAIVIVGGLRGVLAQWYLQPQLSLQRVRATMTDQLMRLKADPPRDR